MPQRILLAAKAIVFKLQENSLVNILQQVHCALNIRVWSQRYGSRRYALTIEIKRQVILT